MKDPFLEALRVVLELAEQNVVEESADLAEEREEQQDAIDLVNEFLEEQSGEAWHNDAIQFPRLISEIEVAGGFTPRLTEDLLESMDLDEDRLVELIDRAQSAWEWIKQQSKEEKRP